MMASAKPRSSITSPRHTYMTPMRLWSTLVSHSRHKYGHQPRAVMSPSTMRRTMPTTAALISGSGSLSGIADQLSLPSIPGQVSLANVPVTSARIWTASISAQLSTCCISTSSMLRGGMGGGADIRPFGIRYGLVDDAFEQPRSDRAIDARRRGRARLGQFGVAGLVERGAGALRLRDPSVEVARRHCLDDKPHLGKAGAAEISREPGELARRAREQVEVRGHAAHRVDLAAELRHEEGIHHRRRGEPKLNRCFCRDDQLIDGRDALVWIDEQPLPIERHHVHPEWVGLHGNRRPRIQLMCADPDHPAEQDHRQGGN